MAYNPLHTCCHTCDAIETKANPLYSVGLSDEYGLFCEHCIDDAEFAYKEMCEEEAHAFINSPSW